MFRKRKKKLQQELDTFQNTVIALMDGIHKFDSHLEKTLHEESYSYDNIAFIARSVEDLNSACDVYKDNYFFHNYNAFRMNKCMELLTKALHDMEPLTRDLHFIVNGYKQGITLLEQIEEADDIESYQEEFDDTKTKLKEVQLHIQKMLSEIGTDILSMRSMLLLIREIVSRDYFKIILKSDLIEAYEIEEKRMKHEIKAVIRYHEKMDKKSLLAKENVDHE